jgi:hypothetical protein
MFLVRNPIALLDEKVNDFQYLDHKSIRVPSSRILIGTANTLEDAALYYSLTDLTMDLTLGAVNLGLDTGAEAQDQWYAVYAVPGSNGSYGLRFSANAPYQAGGSGPVGFTKYRYLGLVRNGGNFWDATNNSYGRGDIVHFVKQQRETYFQAFHTNNGGLYPVVPGFQHIMLGVSNTSTNGVVFNVTIAGNVGFTGLSANGAAKLPYRHVPYLFGCGVNANSVVSMIFEDDSGNSRHAILSGSNSGASLWGCEGWQNFSINDNWVAAIRLNNNANSNVSRFIGFRAMRDPYILGGK